MSIKCYLCGKEVRESRIRHRRLQQGLTEVDVDLCQKCATDFEETVRNSGSGMNVLMASGNTSSFEQFKPFQDVWNDDPFKLSKGKYLRMKRK